MKPCSCFFQMTTVMPDAESIRWQRWMIVCLPDRCIARALSVMLMKKIRRRRSDLLICAIIVESPEIRWNVKTQRST